MPYNASLYVLQSQAQECTFEKLILHGVQQGMESYATLAQNAAKVCGSCTAKNQLHFQAATTHILGLG